MGTLAQDVRYALRWLARNPGFAAVAVATLALGIGTVTTIFSILDAAVLRPLPYREPDALMTVAITHRDSPTATETETFPWSSPKFESLRRHAASFERVAAYGNIDLNLTGVSEPERLSAEIVSADYFPVLGVDAVLGRTFARGGGQGRAARTRPFSRTACGSAASAGIAPSSANRSRSIVSR